MSSPASATPWSPREPNSVMRERIFLSSSTGATSSPVIMPPSARTSSRSGASVKA